MSTSSTVPAEPLAPPRLRHSIIALGVIQAGGYLIPLITLPYLTRVLGPQGYGKVAFVLVVMSLLMLLVDYGFSWSATRQIAANRNDCQRVATIFSETWAAQWWLVSGAALLLAAALATSAPLRTAWPLYAFGFLYVIGNVLFPMWLFQGLERLKMAAVIQLLSRLVTLPLVFLLVRSPDDLVGAVVFQVLGTLLGGILAIAWLFLTKTVAWRRPDRTGIVGALRVGADVFVGKAAVAMYTAAVPLALGALTGPTQVGYFVLADRVRNLIQSLLAPISQVSFARLSFLVQADAAQGQALLRYSASVTLGFAGVAGALMFLLADPIVYLLAGGEYAVAATVMRWLAFVPFVVAVSNLLGVQTMIPKGMSRPFSVILVGGALLSLSLMHPLISAAQAVGAAQLVLTVELAVSIAMLGYFAMRKARTTRSR